ncbi:MAG: hypothetical protein HY319_11220 [Armatimonadetes bacterium]|nr:hypothetical protein [Armatimonadota bacterium]
MRILRWIVIALILGGCGPTYTETLASVSPDGKYRAKLLDRSRNMIRIDRNFRVAIEAEGETIQVLELSPDEGAEGAERFLWSVDSQHLLLVGRNFLTEGDAALAGGEKLYLLYHVPARRLWFNGRTAGERFGPELLKTIPFAEPLVFEETEPGE